ncbi:hypothetical protein GQ54DRAFT_296287 [Martensiomyces pterosporus]|nr:hypothetical protein GQ54DRAFT_296287 [Martensiomyces pterosporus]
MSSNSSSSPALAPAEHPVRTMQDLISRLNSTLGNTGLGDDLSRVHQVKKLMREYISQSDDWYQYAVYQEGTRYTRNLVDDGNGKYNLLILVWGEGQSSPIHDHAGSHCMMKLLAGELDEELYAWPTEESVEGEQLRLKRVAPLKTNSVAYMHDKIGLHRIGNPSTSKKAVSLHLYSPPFSMCKTFDQSTGAAVESSCAASRITPPPSETPSSSIYTCAASFEATSGPGLQPGHAITSI